MAFKFYLDGQLVDQPMNDKDLSTSIKRNSTLGALLVTQDVDLEWNGNNEYIAPVISGYSYLKGIFDAGTCSEVEIKITEDISPTQTATIYVGVIKVPSLRFRLHQVIVNCQIQDNSFYSYINNNKSIKYNIQSTTTKNGVLIVSPPIYGVDMFDGQNGTYLSSLGYYYSGYRVYDVFEFLVSAISDNKLAFYSNFLQQEPCPFIFDGHALADYRLGPNFSVSFNDLYTECQKIYNMSFFIDYSNYDAPILVMEPKQNLYQGLSSFEFTDIKDLELRAAESNLYGTVRVGAENNPSGAAVEYTQNNPSYYAYNDEVFMPLGQCNIDSELDLLSSFHITNNDINYQVNGGSSNFYEDLFLVECESVDTSLQTAVAVQYLPWAGATGANVVFYNYGFSNLQKLANNGDNIQTILSSTLASGVGGFKAGNSAEFNVCSSDSYYINSYLGLPLTYLAFNNVSGAGYYNAGDYNAGTGEFTAPSAGQYSFNANYKFDVDGLKTCFTNFYINNSGPGLPVGSYQNIYIMDTVYITGTIEHYDSGMSLINSQSQQVIVRAGQDSAGINVNYTATMSTGDIIKWSLETKLYKTASFGVNNTGTFATFPVGANFTISQPLHPDFGYGLTGNPYYTWNWINCANTPTVNVFCTTDSSMGCTGTPTNGITVGVGQPGTFDQYQYSFTYEIPQSDFLIIKADPTSLFIFEKDGIERVGWIDTLKRNDWTGVTQITLVTNNATTTQ